MHKKTKTNMTNIGTVYILVVAVTLLVVGVYIILRCRYRHEVSAQDPDAVEPPLLGVDLLSICLPLLLWVIGIVAVFLTYKRPTPSEGGGKPATQDPMKNGGQTIPDNLGTVIGDTTADLVIEADTIKSVLAPTPTPGQTAAVGAHALLNG
jgi:heme/copper-type cytochrome/quinol oxidase subunit 2